MAIRETEMHSVRPSELFMEGNPFKAEMLLVGDYSTADVRFTPPCRLGEKAIEHMCNAYGNGEIDFDINVETSEATILSMFVKDMNKQPDNSVYAELYEDITIGILDLLGRAHNPELFRK